MSQVFTYQNKKEYSSGKPNTVLKSTKLDWRAVQVVKGDGSITVVFAVRFGKDPETGKPQIAIFDWPKINENFIECPKPLYEQLVDRWDAEDNTDKALNINTNLGQVEVGDLP